MKTETINYQAISIAPKAPVEVALHIGKMKGGGVEAIMLSYVQNIDRHLVHYTVLVDEDSTIVPEEEFKASGATLVIVPPYQRVFAYHKALYQLFKDRKFSIVHININTLAVFPLFAAWRAGIPVRINHNHNTAGKGEWKRNIAKYMLRPFSRLFATELCACSEYAGRWLFGDKANFTVMPNSIDYYKEKYLFDADAREYIRKRLGLDDAMVVGHVGRFIPQKNHSFLLEVFNEIKKLRNNAKLLLVGSGEGQNEIKQKACAVGISDSIVFLGQREDVNILYSAMDVLVFPSLYEGFGMVPQEAQYSGLPCIVSDCITRKIVVSDQLVTFLPLETSTVEWAKTAIAQYDNAVFRRDTFEHIAPEIADNKLSADKLGEWYVSLVKRAE